jgi:hypothetical protein
MWYTYNMVKRALAAGRSSPAKQCDAEKLVTMY